MQGKLEQCIRFVLREILYLGLDQSLVCRVITGARDDYDRRAPLRERGGNKCLELLHGEFDLQTVEVDIVIAVQLIAIGVYGGETLCQEERTSKAMQK